MRPGYVSHIFLVFICKYFLKANSNQAFTDWKSTAGSVFNERSVGIQVSYCFCLSLRTRMIHFSDMFGLMNCRMKILQLFKKKKKAKATTLFMLHILQSSILCCYYRERNFFAMFDTWLRVPWFEYQDLLWNIPEFVTEDSFNSVQLCISVA